MARAKKLPSGSWRCQVYSHSEPVKDSAGNFVYLENGKPKMKRIYQSFTCDDPSPVGRRKAEKMAADFAADKDLAKHQNKSVSDITLREAFERYISDRDSVLSPGTIREYTRSKNRDLKNLMDLKINEITQGDIQIEINREARTHSPKTIRNMHGFLVAVLKEYRPDFAINTKLPQKIPPDLYIPSDNDIQTLMDATSGTVMEIPVLLAAFGPMRRGEISALDSKDVERSVVHVRHAFVQDKNRNWVLKTTKSYAGVRDIEFHPAIMEKLQEFDGRIVKLTPDAITKRFARILKRYRLPHFRFHDLRHYAASIYHAMGIPDAYIMERGGWKNDNTLKNVYRHALDQEKKKNTEKANKHFEKIMQHEMQHNK